MGCLVKYAQLVLIIERVIDMPATYDCSLSARQSIQEVILAYTEKTASGVEEAYSL